MANNYLTHWYTPFFFTSKKKGLQNVYKNKAQTKNQHLKLIRSKSLAPEEKKHTHTQEKIR